MTIEKEILDQLLAGRDPRELFAKNGLVDELKKAISERILNTELDEHLDSKTERSSGNYRKRNHVERFFSRFKQCRHIATRCEKRWLTSLL